MTTGGDVLDRQIAAAAEEEERHGEATSAVVRDLGCQVHDLWRAVEGQGERIGRVEKRVHELDELVHRMLGTLERRGAATPPEQPGSEPQGGARGRWVEAAWSARNDTLGQLLTALVAEWKRGAGLPAHEVYTLGALAVFRALEAVTDGVTPVFRMRVLDELGSLWVCGPGSGPTSPP